MMEGVEKTVRITEKYKLVSRHFHPEDTVVDVDGVKIGGKEVVVMAGPCSVESIDQLREAAHAVKQGGAQFLRGGAFKPRTSPYDFQGLAEEGLKMLRQSPMRKASRSSRRSSTRMISNSSANTPTFTRSARATCRISSS